MPIRTKKPYCSNHAKNSKAFPRMKYNRTLEPSSGGIGIKLNKARGEIHGYGYSQEL